MTPSDELSKSKQQLLDERLVAEQAQRDTLAQLQGVINAAVDGILAIDEAGIVQWLNPAALAIFGYAAEEIIGRNVKVLMPDPYRSEHDQYLQNYLHTGQARIIGIGREVQGLRKDGSVFPLDLAVSEVRLGSRRMFTGIVRDITQRKATERELVHAKDSAIAASTAKDQFIAVVSHELRTPLTPILAAVSFLERQPDLPQDVRDEIDSIRRNVEHETRLVDDLLNLTRLARGKIELHHEVVDAHALLHTALVQFQSDIDDKRLLLSTALRARQHYVWADPVRIRQVFTNLLSNAIKFSQSEGEIAVRTSNTPDGRFRFEIADTGIGIDPDVLQRLFNPFEQGEQTVIRRFGGLGLGLAISKGIVDLHRGKLLARSDGRDQGATFIMELSTVPSVPAAPQVEPPAPSSAGRGRRVLLVEDHHDTQRIMVKLLRASGYTVTAAATLAEAIRLAESHEFDILVSDIGLPDGSGLDLMRHLSSRHPLKAIAVSGFGQPEDIRRSREAGFLDHLVKPVNFQKLQSLLGQISAN